MWVCDVTQISADSWSVSVPSLSLMYINSQEQVVLLTEEVGVTMKLQVTSHDWLQSHMSASVQQKAFNLQSWSESCWYTKHSHSVSYHLPVDTVLTLKVRHAGSSVNREANELLRLQLVLLLPQEGQEVSTCQNSNMSHKLANKTKQAN